MQQSRSSFDEEDQSLLIALLTSSEDEVGENVVSILYIQDVPVLSHNKTDKLIN